MITIFADELYDAHKTDYYVPSKESGIPCMPPFRKFQMRFRGATVRFSVFDNNGFVHSDFYQSLQSWIFTIFGKFRAGLRADFRSFSEIPIYLLPPEIQELASEAESLEHFLKELVPTTPLFLMQEVTYQKMPLGTVVIPLERNGNVIGDYFSMVASDDMTQEDADHFISLSEFSVFVLAVLNCDNVKLKEHGSSCIYQPTGKKEPKNGIYRQWYFHHKKSSQQKRSSPRPSRAFWRLSKRQRTFWTHQGRVLVFRYYRWRQEERNNREGLPSEGVSQQKKRGGFFVPAAKKIAIFLASTAGKKSFSLLLVSFPFREPFCRILSM